MSILKNALFCFALAATALPATAHEFWISPQTYVVQNGGRVQADLRVGENFNGSAYSYNPKQFERFEFVQNAKRYAVDGRLGDTPAMSLVPPGEGLLTIVHETKDLQVTYREWKKFVKFTDHKDFAQVQQTHIDRGLPQEGFLELYRRYGKSLVAVGSGAGKDRALGLRTEIVALANPYTDAISSLPVQVLFEGKPRANTQVELFDKSPSGSVKVTLHRTNSKGLAAIPVRAGHEYLVDSVTILPLESRDPKTIPASGPRIGRR